MKVFNVFKSPQGKYEVVKIGWSWPVSIFGTFWLIYKRLWKELLIFSGIMIGFLFTIGVCQPTYPTEQYNTIIGAINLILNIVIVFIFGKYGNLWIEKKLQKRGFEMVANGIIAETAEGAINKYLKNIG